MDSYNYLPSSSTPLTFTSSITILAISSTPQTFTLVSSPSSPSYVSSGGFLTGQIGGVVGKLTNTSTSGTYTFTPIGMPTINVTSGTNVPPNTFYPTTDRGIGRLQVAGRTIDGTVTNGATSDVKQVIGSSVIQVEIPITPGDINNIPIPGTWPQDTVAPSGNQTFASDLLVSCDEVTTDIRLETRSPAYTANKTGMKLPTVPTAPTTAYPIQGTIPTSGDTTLPNTSGYNPLTGGYDYIVSEISSTSNTLTINPNYKVTIYLTGDIDMGGNSNINHSKSSEFNSTSSPTSPVTIVVPLEKTLSTSEAVTLTVPAYSSNYLAADNTFVYGFLGSANIPGKLSKINTTVRVQGVDTTTQSYTFTPMTIPSGTTVTVPLSSTFTPSTAPYKEVDFKIYGDGTTSPSSPPKICLSGGATVEGFILAPKYTFGMRGGGNANSIEATTTGISGSIWVGSYPAPRPCSSDSNKIVVTQKGSWEDIGLSPENMPPNLAASQTWNKKEVE